MQIKELLQFGIINIDKPSGPTSHQVAEYTRKILNVNKSGHSGTLDPKVTGCLPVALGKATRIIELLMGNSKEYICVIELHKDLEEIGEEELRKIILSFKGKIKQTPPVKSAVKRQEREREIYDIEILQIGKRETLFRVDCEAGTYLRLICHNIGQKLGCGAQMKELRRIRSGIFKEDTLVTLNDLRDAYELWKEGNEEKDKQKIERAESLLKKYIHPVEYIVKDMNKVYVNESGLRLVNNGQNLRENNVERLKIKGSGKGEKVAIINKDKLIALGKLTLNSKPFKNNRDKLAVNVYKVFGR